ncbi:MAG: hypothetical protein ACOC4S_01495 [Balneolaceae bacterium]
MKSINSHRVFKRNSRDPDPEGKYVLYWIQVNRRFNYNFALQYAVGWANKLGKPLLVLEGLSCDYPWACDRIHTFMMEGIKENLEYARQIGLNYYPFLEKGPGKLEALLHTLASQACCVITDEYPVYIIRERNERISKHAELETAYISVDSNGLIPLGLTDKAPYNAYFFRKIMQQHFIESYTQPPEQHPLKDLKNNNEIALDRSQTGKYPSAEPYLDEVSSFLASLDIRHDVKPLKMSGTRQAALGKLGQFIQYGLLEYDEKRNDPDEKKTSGLSPWLHFGKISEYEIVKAVLDHQPKGWDLGRIRYNNGSAGAFFNGDPNIDSYLDEVITWREVGFHFAHHESGYDQFESLPEWAKETLNDHRDDPREHIYTFEELEQAQTHDDLWNAAQTQLRQEGVIHNYLRMLWGKKVIEWTPDPQTALQYLIELNNQYAIDGRDPNSYSGIFWCFGRFDRAWQERPIFGKVRYMTSKSARKKIKLTQYLDTYGSQESLL